MGDRRSDAPRVNAFLFVVLSGARLADGGARLLLESETELVIGRGDKRTRKGNALSVADGRMSGAHAKIGRDAEGWFIEDLGSTNGTAVNGSDVKRAKLTDGDVIECGQTLFSFREIVGDHKTPDLGSCDIDRPDGFATLDPALAKKLQRLERVASSNLSVLLMGETGTGKEVLAKGVHKLSGRPGPFVAVNCGAIPANLVESHLFGHTKGAFSGALRDEPGHVRAANFGTLLLDEIGDLPASAQAALLRVLQEGEVVPVGSTAPMKVDVRVIGATHKSLEELVAAGTFRQDLYARLAGYVFPVPPLRERKVDLGLLVATLAERGKIERELRIHRRRRARAPSLRVADERARARTVPQSERRARGGRHRDARRSPGRDRGGRRWSRTKTAAATTTSYAARSSRSWSRRTAT